MRRKSNQVIVLSLSFLKKKIFRRLGLGLSFTQPCSQIENILNCVNIQYFYLQRFLGKCWCEQGWESSTGYNDSSKLQCTLPIFTIADCQCEPDDKTRSFLKNDSWWIRDQKGDVVEPTIRCTNLCKSNSQIGVPIANPTDWEENQG